MTQKSTSLALQRSNMGFSLVLNTMDEALRFAEIAAKTDMVPESYKKKPYDVFIAIQMGAELGLPPILALQSIAVIKGQPSLWGDGLLAVVKSHPDCIDIIEKREGNKATCTVKRRNCEPVTREFTVEDATRAGLWGGRAKDQSKRGLSPWALYPYRMLQMRARSWALRDAFADVLMGFRTSDEAEDFVGDDPVQGEIVDSHPISTTEEPEAASVPVSQTDRVKAQLQARQRERTPNTDAAEILQEFNDAADADSLKFIGEHWSSAIKALPEDTQKELRDAYETRQAQLKNGQAGGATDEEAC